ncbi:hypothetical protein ACU19_04935 [Actinobaculum suis]|uniref:hypothetical protein n=1 Tax=Actinobaculum suis TaxID=1657 RepID=UPI00066FF682|nr:hypothetical protein [Actinobaculum suis]KMY23319.1 hypothetical protein ACU19_04935 [Actinobaculum suis]
MTTEKKAPEMDPKTFDLAAFIAGASQETRFVDVCQDRRLLAEIDYLRQKVEQSGKKSTTLAGSEDERELRKLTEKAASKWVRCEITAPNRELYIAAIREYCDEAGLDADEVMGGGGIPPEKYLDYGAAMLSRFMTYPRLPAREDMTRFLEAIGDIQATKLVGEFESATATSLASLGPDSPFWRVPSHNQDGPES